MDEIDRTFCLQILALACVNALALVYDGQWLPVAVGLDCAMFGYQIGTFKRGKE